MPTTTESRRAALGPAGAGPEVTCVPGAHGDVAQRESTCFARRGSAVQIRSSPPIDAKSF